MALEKELVELYKRLKRNEIRRLVEITRKLQQKYGPQVADDIAEVLTERVHEKWNRMDKGDANLNMLYNLMWASREGIMDKVIDVKEENKLKIRVTNCFYADEYKRLNAQDLGYKFSCMCEYPAVDVFNPRIRFRRQRTLMQDCEYCDHCYVIVEQDEQE